MSQAKFTRSSRFLSRFSAKFSVFSVLSGKGNKSCKALSLVYTIYLEITAYLPNKSTKSPLSSALEANFVTFSENVDANKNILLVMATKTVAQIGALCIAIFHLLFFAMGR